MFQKLVHDWKEERGLEPRQVAEKVKRFFAFYVSQNSSTPSTAVPLFKDHDWANLPLGNQPPQDDDHDPVGPHGEVCILVISVCCYSREVGR